MARVFLAEDTELEREVVIKVLAPHLVDDAFVERFRNEVLQTARLQHPTIVSLFDVGAIKGEDGRELPFYVMPYVRGESLRSRLQHEGSLSVSATIRVLRSVLDALVYAHAHGVVHRDIKPENIFLSGTNAVLADFGIAKAVVGRQRSATITSPGTTVGTPAYMAPEQLAGDADADHRADLYSVGVVAYEMLAGRLPWGGNSPSEMLSAQARSAIVPLPSLRVDAPEALVAIIEKCLAWEAAKRPASAGDVLRVVEGVSYTPTTPRSVVARPGAPARWRSRRAPLVAVAVLLLGTVALLARRSNRGGDTSRRPVRLAVLYPELGPKTRADSTLSEQVYHLLASSLRPVLGLQLVGEISVPEMRLRGLTPDQIADSLRVDSVLVLETAPALNGERLLQVELRERRERRQSLLAVAGPASLQSLQRLTPDSVQALLKQLSGQVASRLGLTSTNRGVSTTQKTEAWIAWSDGRDASARRTPDGLRSAIRFYKQALALDSQFVQAQTDLSLAMSNAMWYRYRTDDGPGALAAGALRFAERAIEMQPSFADGYLARGYIGVIAGAPVDFLEQNYGQAQRLASTNPFSGTWYVGLLAVRGKFEEALARLDEEVRRDPNSPAQRITRALYALPARQYLTAVRSAREAHAMQPGIPVTSSFELWGLLAIGGAAQDECVGVDAGPYLGARALCLERTGHEREARTVVDSLSRIVTAKAPMDSTFDLSLYVAELALYHAAHGNRADAMLWLRQVFHESPIGIDFRLMRVSSFFSGDFVALSDSLRRESWSRVLQAAAKKQDLASRVPPGQRAP